MFIFPTHTHTKTHKPTHRHRYQAKRFTVARVTLPNEELGGGKEGSRPVPKNEWKVTIQPRESLADQI